MITHCVLFKIREDVSAERIESVFSALAGLKDQIPGILSFEGGPYSSGEGLNKGYTHGFVMTFPDAGARDAYLLHPAHEVVKAQVLEVLQDGLDGVVAFDFES